MAYIQRKAPAGHPALRGAGYIATRLHDGGCMDSAGLALLCILAADRPMVHRSANFWAISYCRPSTVAWRSLLFWGLTDLGRDVLSRLLSGAAARLS